MAREVNQSLAREFGLSADEYQRVAGVRRVEHELAADRRHADAVAVAAHAPDHAVHEVEMGGTVALRYCTAKGEIDEGANPNGALNAVAGLLNRDGNVLGMMPHPERRVRALLGGEDGVGLVRGLVEAA